MLKLSKKQVSIVEKLLKLNANLAVKTPILATAGGCSSCNSGCQASCGGCSGGCGKTNTCAITF